MASVYGQSLREEFEARKRHCAQQCTDGKITAESRALFKALLMLRSVPIAVFMEKNSGKTSAHSSKSSSQTRKGETSISRAGAHTKGKPYNPSRTHNSPWRRRWRSEELPRAIYVPSRVSPVVVCPRAVRNAAPRPMVPHIQRLRLDGQFDLLDVCIWSGRTPEHSLRGAYGSTTGVDATLPGVRIADGSARPPLKFRQRL